MILMMMTLVTIDFSDTDFGADRLNDERTASAKEKKQSYEDFDLDFIDLDD